MFRRLVLEHTTAIVTIAAFLTAASIYAAVVWRALRMKRPQLDRLAQIPFEDETRPASRHDAN
jgi:hypothetical protein